MKVAIGNLTYVMFWHYVWHKPEDKKHSDYTTSCFIKNAESGETLIHAHVEKHPKKRKENRENARKASLGKCLNQLFPGDRRNNSENKTIRASFWEAYLNRPRVAGTPKAKQEVPSDTVQSTEQGS